MKKLLLLLFFTMTVGANAQLLSVSPDEGNAGQTLQVTITGVADSFIGISSTEGVSFYNDASEYLVVNTYNVVSATELVATVTIPTNATQGLYNIKVFTAWSPTELLLPNAFNVVNTYNTITGNITLDANGNGCDSGDNPMQNVKITATDGSNNSLTFTDANGDYTIYVPAGNFTVAAETNMAYFTFDPPSGVINFATQNNLTESLDFCMAPDGVHNDLDVSILPIGPARPGFDATYYIVYKNNGNQVLSGSVNFNYDDSRMDFVSADIAPSSQSVDNLNWNYTNLLPSESRSFYVVFNVNSPMETPAVNNGDVLTFIATATPISGDDTPEDNVFTFNQVVVGSYDPNDKAVTEGPQIRLEDVGNYLHYLIRFQNTGTFMAENVRVKDVLSANLDVSTLEVISASHDYRTTLTSGNELEFFFDNINLPPEEEDEPGSNGFVAFRIKPAASVGVGSVIENTAEIYFDFNFPIITNTVSTTVVLLSTESYDMTDFRIYPNPASEMINLDTQLSGMTSVKIYNQLGQLVKSVNNIPENRRTISVEDLQTGTYYLQISCGEVVSTKKLIKL